MKKTALVARYLLGLMLTLFGLNGFLHFIPHPPPTSALGLTLPGPVLVNILLFHDQMDPAGVVPGVVVTILWFLLFLQHRLAFQGILRSEA